MPSPLAELGASVFFFFFLFDAPGILKIKFVATFKIQRVFHFSMKEILNLKEGVKNV